MACFAVECSPRNQLPPGLDKIVARQLISVIDYLHTCGYVHTGTELFVGSIFPNPHIDINPQNVLISLPAQYSSVKDILETHPIPWSHGPWFGDPPGDSAAFLSSNDKISIPGTLAQLVDSDPIRTPDFITEKTQLVIKLVGYGHGPLLFETD